jgi:outer membrane receptor protein involved in Fe transport
MASAIRGYSDEAMVQELRLVSNGDNSVDWVVGGFYRDQDLNATQTSYLVGFEAWADAAFGNPNLIIQDQDFDYERDETFRDMALFGEATWHATESFHLTLGLRWFENDSDNLTYIQVGPWDPSIFNFEDTAFFEDEEKDTLFKVNAAWNLSDAQTLYATVSEGYRRGGSNAVPTVGFFAVDPAWQIYGPDSVTNYELGLKGSTDRVQYSAALFYVDGQDVQLNTSAGAGFFVAANGDSARTNGLELELDGYISDRVRYNIGYAYVDGKLTGDALSPTGSGFVLAEKGAPLIGTAEHTLNAALQFSRDLPSGKSWTTRVNAYYQSETENAFGDGSYAPGTFTATLDGFTLLDFVTWVSSDDWHLSLYAKNLTNEAGTTGQFSNQYMGTDPAQNYFGNGSKVFLSLPRTIGVAFTYEF